MQRSQHFCWVARIFQGYIPVHSIYRMTNEQDIATRADRTNLGIGIKQTRGSFYDPAFRNAAEIDLMPRGKRTRLSRRSKLIVSRAGRGVAFETFAAATA